MRNLVLSLAALFAIAAAVGLIAYRASGDAAVERALARQDPMAWLRADFNLSAAQFAAIRKLHDSYSVVCEEHCREIQGAFETRERLKAAAPADVAAIAAAERRVEALRLVCESAIATHVRQCAAEMSPEARERYLALVLPKIKDFDHQAAPDVQLNRHRHQTQTS